MKNILNNLLTFLKKHIKKLIITIVVIAISVGVFLFVSKPKVNPEEAIDPTKRTIVLQKGELYSSVNIKGIIQSNEVSTVSTNLNTKVIEVNVKVGDQVKKGDIILKLDSAEIQREIAEKSKESNNEKASLQEAYDKLVKQKNTLLENKKTLENDKNNVINKAKATLDQKNGDLNNYKNIYNDALNNKNNIEAKIKASTDSVAAADAAAKAAFARIPELQKIKDTLDATNITPNEGESEVDYQNRKKAHEEAIIAADNNLANEKAQLVKLQVAQDGLNEAKKLYNYDEAVSKLNSAQDKLNSLNLEKADAENLYNQAISDKNTALKEADNNINSLNDNINEAYKKIKDFTGSPALKELNEKLKNTILKAESDGKVTELKVTVGSVANGNLATIQSTSKLMIAAKVQDYDITKISVGQLVKVSTDASNEVFEGKLTRISPTASNEGDFDVDISLPESDKLYIGTKARAEIVLFSKKDVISVPVDAILDKDDGSYVIVKNSDKYSEVKVTKGEKTDIFVEIQGPEIKEGLEIMANADWDALKAQADTAIKNAGGF